MDLMIPGRWYEPWRGPSWLSLITLVNLPSFRVWPLVFSLRNVIFRIPQVDLTFGIHSHELSLQSTAKVNNTLVLWSLRWSENRLHEQPNCCWKLFPDEYRTRIRGVRWIERLIASFSPLGWSCQQDGNIRNLLTVAPSVYFYFKDELAHGTRDFEPIINLSFIELLFCTRHLS